MVGPRQRKWILSAGVLGMVAIVAVAVFTLLPEDAPRPAAGDVDVSGDAATGRSS